MEATADLVQYLSGFVTEERLSRFDAVLSRRTRYITVVLEDIYQQHNSSAVLRTCDCFGIQDVHVVEKRNRFNVNDEIALGASKWLSLHIYGQPQDQMYGAIATLKQQGYRVVATVPDPRAVPLEKFDLNKGKIALLFGTELTGLSREAIEQADEFLVIPMAGFTESFNISVSAGIILHHLSHVLRHSELAWQLKREEKNQLKLEWLRNTIRNPGLIESRFLSEKK